MRELICISFLITSLNSVLAQQNFVPIHHFYRDRYFHQSSENSTGFFPVAESKSPIWKKLRDSTVTYFEFEEVVYKKHLIEIKDTNCFLTVSPIFDWSLGRDILLKDERKLFQNTRGVFIEGDLKNNFSFGTSIFENQSRLSTYETAYVNSRGEFYPLQNNNGYARDNAVIPGGARTKDFKGDGFDYGHAVGYINYAPNQKLQISTGNNHHFIGAGYRSVLYSDNSIPSPYLRVDYQIHKKWHFQTIRSRGLNLIRKRRKTTVEAYYQPKGMSLNYLTFQPSSKISISLFEGTSWKMGDSLNTKPANPLFWNPVPFVASFLKDEVAFSVQGLNVQIQSFKDLVLYGQFALQTLSFNERAFQLGGRYYWTKGKLFSHHQMEFNHASSGMYEAYTDWRNYSQYNLPLAHTQGNGFSELVLRSNGEWNRLYYDIKYIHYWIRNQSNKHLLPIQTNEIFRDFNINHFSFELGYRLNKKMNVNFFGNFIYRKTNLENEKANGIVQIGMRTGIINRANDY